MRRRSFLRWSGGFAAALALSPEPAIGGSFVEIAMRGRTDGSKVWFDPYGLLIRPGRTVRWTNRDEANSHSATAYAASNYGHPRRIPKGARSFDSGLLLPGETFETTLEVPGVYDFFCIPHEMAGMVGRIVVAEPGRAGFENYPDGDLPRVVLDGFPSIATIVARGVVRKKGA